MHPILFTIGRFNFYTHGLVAVLGIILAALIIFRFAKKEDLNTELFVDNVIFTTLFGIIGARLAYFFIYPEQFSSPKELFNLIDGGLVSYGGFFLGGICYWLFLRSLHEKLSRWFDISAIGFFFGLMLGRLGDVLAGEYYGVSANFSIPLLKITNIVPISLYESILCLVIFIVSYIFYLRRSQNYISGIIATSSILYYAIGRFILDYWRTEDKIYLGLSIGQIVDLALAVVAASFIVTLLAKNRRAYEAESRVSRETT